MKVIRLEAKRKVETRPIRGVDFHVAVSPYFFPERLECDYRQDTGCFEINLKYLDEEPSVVGPESDHIATLMIGRNTGKLLSVRFHVDDLKLDRIKMLISDELPKVLEIAKSQQPWMTANYKIAGDVLRENSDEISALVPS
jgi:hypothetical protein